MRDSFGGDGRIPLVDKIIAILVGIAAFAAMFVWGVPGFPPSAWDEMAVIARLRAPATIFPGFWRILANYLFEFLDTATAIRMLRLCGLLVGAGCTTLCYLIIRQILALLTRMSRPYAVWSKRIAPYFAGMAALCFGLSDPLWRISRIFSPESIRLAMFFVIVHLTMRWFVVGKNWRIFLAFAGMGFMAAETPFAFLLPIAFIVVYGLVWNAILEGFIIQPENLPDYGEVAKWRMFFIFLGSLALGIWLNAYAFMKLGGIEACGWNANDIYIRYAGGYWHVLADAASPMGWLLAVIFCVLPFAVGLKLFPMVMRDDEPMRFNIGILLFAIASFAVMQCGAFPAARFWTFTKGMTLVKSGFLLTVFLFLAMVALALSASAFAFECQQKYLDPKEKRPAWWLRGLVQILMLAVAGLAVWRAPNPVETEMQMIVDSAIDEIVDECGDAKWLFTDGRLDSAIELAAKRKGKHIYALNMMSGGSDWEISLRTRGFEENSDDFINATTGVPVLFRTWAGERTNGLEKVAMQVGFGFWQRDRMPLPKFSGMLARECGLDDEAATNGIKRAEALSKRIMAIAPKAEITDIDPTLASAFSAVNWRIARCAHYRNDHELGNDLDLSNSALKKMVKIFEDERTREFMQLTPREGLGLALRRANFAEARRYAAAVLRHDEENPEANFGMGMDALVKGNFQEAEMYLKKVLIKRPKEAATLNNLSIICRKQRRYKEAEDYARRALEILPDQPEVKKTLQDALKRAP